MTIKHGMVAIEGIGEEAPEGVTSVLSDLKLMLEGACGRLERETGRRYSFTGVLFHPEEEARENDQRREGDDLRHPRAA